MDKLIRIMKRVQPILGVIFFVWVAIEMFLMIGDMPEPRTGPYGFMEMLYSAIFMVSTIIAYKWIEDYLLDRQ